jgi:nitric oxide dioxygenase
MLTEKQIDLIQDSFGMVLPISEVAAKLFYDRLFEIAPEEKTLFKNDMDVQGRKLMEMLSYLTASLGDLNEIVPAIQNLAKRHVAYGIKTDYYAPVGEALIWTLEKGLGEAFTNETKEAWVKLYTILSNTMINATIK